MTTKRPAFFSTISITYAEYWRVIFIGTNHEAMYLGEVVLGQYSTSATSPEWGIPKVRAFPGIREKGPSSRSVVYNFCTDPPMDINAKFSARTAAASRELTDSIWLRSGQGRYPVVLIPIDTETDVYFCRPLEPVTVTRPFSGVYETSMVFTGDPFPSVGL